MATHSPIASLPVPGYFSHLAKNYTRTTANTTLDIFTDVLKTHVQTSNNLISSTSIVHDNAAGPGVAIAGIVATLGTDSLPAEILISDNNPAMVAGARDSFSSLSQSNITSKELDAHDLSSISDNYFTHSITNFSIFTFPNAEAAVAEVHRTLQPDGLAVISCWRRFPILPLVHAAQAAIRPDLPRMPVPGPRFFEDGVLQTVLVAAGFDSAKIQVLRRDLVVKDADGIAGLRDFMNGPLMKRAQEGYSDEELSWWSKAIDEALEDEIKQNGGVNFESFVALATK